MSLADPKFTLLVVSCDSYDDCWPPFFHLLRKFWPEFDEPVLLVTERKTFAYPGFQITCSQVADRCSSPRPTWSECVLKSLDQVGTDLVFFILDDFFLDSPVNSQVVHQCADIMARTDYANICFSKRAPGGPNACEHDILWYRRQNTPYLVNANAALWRNAALRRYLRADENAWQFEIFGTIRAHRGRDKFFKMNEQMFVPGQNDVVHYTEDNVVRGKWAQGAPAFLRQHGIELDYSKRGFYKPVPRYLSKLQTLKLVLANPKKLLQVLRNT